MPFANVFPPADKEQWRRLVDGVLKGKSFKTLISKTYDDIPIAPLYQRAGEEQPRVLRMVPGPWSVVQRIDLPDPIQANKQALTDLENGATGLQLVFAGSAGDYGFGLPDASEDAIAQVLDDIVLETGITIELDLSAATRDAADKVARLIEKRGIEPVRTNIVFGLNPLDAIAHGELDAVDWSSLAPRICGIRPQPGRSRFQENPLRRRCASCSCGRRIGGAGTRLRARFSGRLFAHARGCRHGSRRCTQDGLVPARVRCRSVLHTRQVPCAAAAMGSS